jgi:hypothetical protein
MKPDLITQDLLLEPTATAQWKQLLEHAKQQCHCQLEADVESYLIFTLMRFTREPGLTSTALGPELINCSQLSGQARENKLRDVGDQCLLLSGLFPQRAEKRLVQVGYYVDLGMTAYQHLSDILRKAFAELYQLLSQNFVQMMDVLQNIRGTAALQPLQAMELWQHTGSASALKLLKDTTNSTPILIDQTIRH